MSTDDNSDPEIDLLIGVGGLVVAGGLLFANDRRIRWQVKHGRRRRLPGRHRKAE